MKDAEDIDAQRKIRYNKPKAGTMHDDFSSRFMSNRVGRFSHHHSKT